MKILLLCEPRSGSTNLARWFLENGFDTRFETTGKNSSYYLPNGVESIKYDKSRHLILKEIFFPENNIFESYINFCDKVIYLYRENEKEQSISYDYAVKYDTWVKTYTAPKDYSPSNLNFNYLKKIKKEFNIFREKNKLNSLSISYEDLYQRSKINIVKKYLGLSDILTQRFPPGTKLRKPNSNKSTVL